MLSALLGFIIAITLAIVAFRRHEPGIAVTFAVFGIVHALYRIRRGG